MYHVSNNRRVLKSCTIIAEAMVELVVEKEYNLNAISIKELCERAQVSKATFYRHFDDPLDVLYWKLNREVEESANYTPIINNNFELFCRSFFEYWTSHSSFLELMIYIGHETAFLYSIERYFRRLLPQIPYIAEKDSNIPYFIVGIWSAGIWSIMKTWVLDGKQESAAKLATIAWRNLPDFPGLDRYFGEKKE